MAVAPATGPVETTEGVAALRAVRIAKRLFLTALFIAGILGGIRLYSILNPPIDYGSLPPLAEAAEPRAADFMTDLVERGDEAGLAAGYPTEMLSELSAALTIGEPGGLSGLNDVRRVDYLGSVSDGVDTLALYVAHGVLESGVEVAAGFSIRVRDGEVVGVN
jgi:hypothetical protein